jgi:predicted aspartyl protease
LEAEELSKEAGRIDHRGRPVLRLETPAGVSFLALVDTGFNGQLLLSDQDARALGFQVDATAVTASLAGDIIEKMNSGRGIINWMGSQRRIELIVGSQRPALRRDDDPIALIGSELLTPHLVFIDYQAKTVEIETQK